MFTYLPIYKYQTLVTTENMTCSRQENYQVAHLYLNEWKPGQIASQIPCNADTGHSCTVLLLLLDFFPRIFKSFSISKCDFI